MSMFMPLASSTVFCTAGLSEAITMMGPVPSGTWARGSLLP